MKLIKMKGVVYMENRIKEELNLIKEIIESECGDKIKLIFAEKPGWLLMKTAERNKGIGAIRLNKKSFLTLYIDTKEEYLLADKIHELDSFKGRDIDVVSKKTGNFVQNKIKLLNENAIDFVIDVINKCFDENAVQIGKRIRSQTTAVSVA